MPGLSPGPKGCRNSRKRATSCWPSRPNRGRPGWRRSPAASRGPRSPWEWALRGLASALGPWRCAGRCGLPWRPASIRSTWRPPLPWRCTVCRPWPRGLRPRRATLGSDHRAGLRWLCLPSLESDRPHLPSGAGVGVDIGGSKVLGVRWRPGGGVQATVRRPTPSKAADVVQLVLEVAAELGAQEDGGVVPLGVGCPGMVDRTGTAHFCPHLHELDGFPLGDKLASSRPPGAVTVVLNDATAACWAEHSLGAGAGADDVLMVTFGTGIGGGVVAGGRLVEGAHGFAGEIGHMVVD